MQGEDEAIAPPDDGKAPDDHAEPHGGTPEDYAEEDGESQDGESQDGTQEAGPPQDGESLHCAPPRPPVAR